MKHVSQVRLSKAETGGFQPRGSERTARLYTEEISTPLGFVHLLPWVSASGEFDSVAAAELRTGGTRGTGDDGFVYSSPQ